MMNESKFQDMYKRWQASDLSVKDFCLNEGIAESTYYYWNKKIKNKRAQQDFISLVVKPPQPGTPQINGKNHPRAYNTRNNEDNLLLELEYPNGTRLRIKQDMDLVHLRTLVCLLD